MNANSFPPARCNAHFDIEDHDDLSRLARQFVDARHLGVLTTVDAEGAPHARWMATFTFDAFPRFLTLTAAHSAKVHHISVNPRVDWMFANEDFTIVLNLEGRARIHTDTVTIKRTWRAIEDKSHPYFLATLEGKSGIAVIETVIERIAFTSAEEGVRRSDVVSFSEPRREHLPPFQPSTHP